MPRRGKPETQRQSQLQQSIPVFLILAFVAAYMFVPTSWVSWQWLYLVPGPTML